MRALVVEPGPHYSVADVQAGWSEALHELGVQTVTFNFAARLGFYASAERHTKDGSCIRLMNDQGAARAASKGIEAACFEWWPAFILIVSCFYIPADILDCIRSRGIKVVLLHTESPYEDDVQLARAEHADLNILNDPTNLERFQSTAPTVYLPHAYRPSLHKPGPPDPDLACDFAFAGTGYRSRIEFLEAVDWSGIDVALAGNWEATDPDSPLRKFMAHDLGECIENADAVRLYNSAKASVNIYRRESNQPELSQGWAMGPREVELAACGTFFLRDSRGEGDSVLPMLPTFDGPADFEDQLRWWLRHDDEREYVARKAHAAVADRTFTSNVGQMLRHLDGQTRKETA